MHHDRNHNHCIDVLTCLSCVCHPITMYHFTFFRVCYIPSGPLLGLYCLYTLNFVRCRFCWRGGQESPLDIPCAAYSFNTSVFFGYACSLCLKWLFCLLSDPHGGTGIRPHHPLSDNHMQVHLTILLLGLAGWHPILGWDRQLRVADDGLPPLDILMGGMGWGIRTITPCRQLPILDNYSLLTKLPHPSLYA